MNMNVTTALFYSAMQHLNNDNYILRLHAQYITGGNLLLSVRTAHHVMYGGGCCGGWMWGMGDRQTETDGAERYTPARLPSAWVCHLSRASTPHISAQDHD